MQPSVDGGDGCCSLPNRSLIAASKSVIICDVTGFRKSLLDFVLVQVMIVVEVGRRTVFESFVFKRQGRSAGLQSVLRSPAMKTYLFVGTIDNTSLGGF